MNPNNDTPEQNGGGFMAGMLLGTIIGGVTAFMLSSDEGKKKAEKLIEEGEKLLSLVEKKAESAYLSLEDQVLQAALGEEETDMDNENDGNSKKRFFKKNGKKIS